MIKNTLGTNEHLLSEFHELVVKETLDELLEKYWNLAYKEGKTGESFGDEANEVLHKIRLISQSQKYVDSDWFKLEDNPPKKETWVLFAVEFDGIGDWRVKQGRIDANNKITLLGASWKPSHWRHLPVPRPLKSLKESDLVLISAIELERLKKLAETGSSIHKMIDGL